jgi:hypothetical protein
MSVYIAGFRIGRDDKLVVGQRIAVIFFGNLAEPIPCCTV